VERKCCHSTKCLILYHSVLCTWCCFTNHFRRLYTYIYILLFNIFHSALCRSGVLRISPQHPLACCRSQTKWGDNVCRVLRPVIVEDGILVVETHLFGPIFASQELRFGSPFSPPLANLEYILRICALLLIISLVTTTSTWIQSEDVLHGAHVIHEMQTKMAPECSHMTTICHFPLWFQWKHLTRLSKLWNFHLVDSKCFQIKLITNKFLFTGRCHLQLSNIRITKRFWLAGDDDYLRGATSINHQVAMRANFKMYSRSAKGGEKGDPNRNPWLAKMLWPLLHLDGPSSNNKTLNARLLARVITGCQV
jgi:hypothetical protein